MTWGMSLGLSGLRIADWILEVERGADQTAHYSEVPPNSRKSGAAERFEIMTVNDLTY